MDIQTNKKLKDLKDMIVELASINKSVCDLWDGNNSTKIMNLKKSEEYSQFIKNNSN